MYNYFSDKHCLFLGQSLRRWNPEIRRAFLASVVLVAAAELTLLAWPIVATIIWKERAFLTWIHFIYAIRIILLGWGAATVRYPHRLYGTGRYSLGWNTARIHGAFAPYRSMLWWARLALLHGIVLTVIFAIATLALLPVFLSNDHRWPMLLWGLSLGFHAIVVVQSLVSVYVVWKFGVHGPVNDAYVQARRKGTVGNPAEIQRQEAIRIKQMRRRRANLIV